MVVGNEDERFMEEALAQAALAAARGEVPVGAVVVHAGQVIARAHNLRESAADPLAHAEILALAQASRRWDGWRMVGCTLYVTLEPCAMCAGAAVNSRIDRLVFGAKDSKGGFCGSLGDIVRDSRLNHRIEVREGVLGDRCALLLRDFFAALRQGAETA